METRDGCWLCWRLRLFWLVHRYDTRESGRREGRRAN